MVTIRTWLVAVRLGSLRDRVQQSGLLGPPWRSVIAVILWLLAFLLTTNLYLLATVLPAVVRDLHTSVSAVESALILFPLLAGMLVPVGRQLVAGLGRRRSVALALTGFAAAQLVVAVSPNIIVLAAAYSLVGGVAGAVLLSAAWSLLDEAGTAESRATGAALLGVAPLAGSAAGPFLGGLVAERTSWRLGFVAVLAVVVGLLIALRRTPATAGTGVVAPSWPARLLVPAGAAAIVVAVGLGEDYGWWRAIRPVVLGRIEIAPFGLSLVPFLIVAGVALIAGGLFTGAHARLAAYATPRFLGAVIVGITLGLATFGALYALLLYLTIGARLDELSLGLALAPFGVGATLANVALLLNKRTLNPRVAVAAGLLVSGLGMGLIEAAIKGWGGGWATVPGFVVLGLGNGLALNRLLILTISSVETDRQAEATAINIGGADLAYALGISILGAVFVGVTVHAIVTDVDRDVGLNLTPAARQVLESRLEDDLRTMTPAQQDAYIKSQPARVQTAIVAAQLDGFKEGIYAALEASLVCLVLALLALAGSELLSRSALSRSSRLRSPT